MKIYLFLLLSISSFRNQKVSGNEVAKLETKRLNEMVKRSLIPALDLVRGQAVSHYEIDGDGNLVFFHT